MKFNKVLSFVTLIFFFFTIIGNLIPVEACADTLNPFNVSTTINGKPLDNIGTLNIKNGGSLSLKFDISPSYNIPLKIGDEITIQLPKIFENLNVNTSNINKFFEVKKDGNKLILIAKQDATKMLNAFITIGVKIQSDKDNTISNSPIIINGVSHTINIKIDKPVKPTIPTTDSGGNTGGGGKPQICHISKTVNGSSRITLPSVDSSNNVLNYQIILNTKDMKGNIELTDNFPEGLELVQGSIALLCMENGMLNMSNDIGKTIHLKVDNNKIFMSGFKPDKTYYLIYQARIPLEFAKNHLKYIIRNTADLNGYKSTAKVTINTIPPNITPEQQKDMIHKWTNRNTFSKIGESIMYGLDINPSYNRLTNAKLIDKLPEGLELDPNISKLLNYSIKNITGEKASYKLDVYEIFKDGSKKTIRSYQNPDGTLYYNLKTNSIEANLGNTTYRFIFYYNTKVNKLQSNITNKAILTYNDMKSNSEVTSTYTSDSGAIEAWKTVNKQTLTEGENPNVQYQIHVKSYGFYPKNYITIKDPLAKGVKLESVEIPKGFTYKVEGNTVIAINSGTEFIAGQSAVIKLNCSLADFKGGTTIYNQANVNGYNTNKVSTKKGYAFTAVKENAENNNQKLEGAVYGVYLSTNNKLLYEVTSNANGELTGQIKGSGDYYLKEIKAPKGYELSNDKIQFKIINQDIGTTVNLGSVYDNELTSKITVKKVSEETGKVLKGAQFTITNSNGQVIKTITTGENGIVSADLYPGTYTIKEVKAPKGYVNGNYTKTFTVTFGRENNQEFTVKDSEILGNLLITKTGLNGVKLNGAQFNITGPNGFNKIVTTGENGVAGLNNLPWGTYKITEIKAPIGYKLDNKSKTVVINSQNVESKQNIVFNDTQILGELNIIKTGKNGTKLEGAEFSVNGPNGFKEVVTTGENGVASLNNLPWGTYAVKEIKAPQGYNLNNKVQTVQITSVSVGQIQSLTFNDYQVLGKLNITKIGSDGVKLEGAQFTISGLDGFKEVATTGENGVASLSNLSWGTYTVKETKAPLGYKLSDKTQAVTINSSDVSQVQGLTFNDTQILGQLNITKTGKDGVKLEGAEFTINGLNGYKEVVTTGENGVASLNNIPWGTYKVKEIKAPQGYELNNKVQTIQVTSESVGQVQSLIFNDTKILGKLNITKVGKNNVKLAGAEFNVSGPNGFNKVVTTNKNGVATLENLQWGTYKIKEINAPIGYKINHETKIVDINKNDVSSIQHIIVVDGQELGNLTITKEGLNKEKLAGATFEVTGPNGFNREVTTDDSGKISLNGLAWGTYKVQEVKAPQGYELNNKSQTVDINSGNVKSMQNLTFTDIRLNGSIKVTKIGKDGKKLAGAEFTITGENNFKKIITTDIKGVATLNNIPWGTYTVKETKAPLGYKLSDKTQAVTIKSSDVSQVQGLTFNDTQILGQLNITKTGKDGVKLEGAEFTINGLNGYKEVVTTGENGVASLNNIPWGTYKVKEIKAPQGYELNNKVQTIQVTSESVGQVQSLTFNDTQILGKLNITKVGKNDVKLAGAEFNVSGPNGFNKMVTTNKNGVATLNNIPWGTYTVKETKAPLGYKLSDKTQAVTIKSSDVSQVQGLTFNDTQILGQLNITKTGKDGVKLAGAEFNVSGPNEFNKVVTTNKNGVATLENLQWGTYKIKELKAPKGYKLNNKVQTIKIDSKDSNEIQRIVVIDGQELGNLTITKEGLNKEKLAGATFEVTGPNGFNREVTTDDSGKISLNGLAWGTYKVQEVKAPQGYELNNKSQTVDINSGNVKSMQNLTFTDIRLNGSIKVTKIGKDGKKLAGAEFTITGENNFKKIITTDIKGVATLNNIPWGTYTVKETKAPLGYKLSDKTQAVTIKSSDVSQVQGLTFNDTQILGQLNITKTGKDGVKLEGAEFTINGPNGYKEVVTTGENGVASLNNIPWGTYKVKEIKAPQGYELNNKVQTIQATSESVGQVQSLTFNDTQILGKLNITKVGKNDVKLAGAEFNVSGPNGFNKMVTTNKNGVATLNNIPWGTYTVKETKAPLGYKLSDKTQAVTIKSSDVLQVQGLTFNDTQILGQLNVTKIGKDGVKLEGAEFIINGPNGYKEVVTTGENGVASLNNIPWGTYKVKEIKAPQGYELNNKVQTIQVTSESVGQVQSLIFNDTQILGKLNITKVGKNNVKLAGAEFNVSGPNEFNKVVTTNKNGVAALENLQWGTYKIKEINAPIGYKINHETKIVDINKNDVSSIQHIIVVDGQELGNLTITKEGLNKEKLAGATFEITGLNGFNREVTTDDNGKISLNGLAWGTYKVQEVKAPQGYELNNKSQTVDINSGNVKSMQNLTFTDIRLNGSIKVTKIGKDGKKLAGAEFTITGENNYKKVITTDINGIATLNNISWGTYTVKETKAPLGYKLSDKTQAVTIKSSDVSQVQGLTFNDTQILGQLNITKTGKDGVKLEGAEFAINGPNGYKEVVTTGENGVASLNNIPWGTYKVKEIKAPQGYELNNKVQTIQVTSESVGQVQSLTFNDTQILGKLNITKVGKNDVKLEGAEFNVSGPNGFNKMVTTNKNGVATLNNIPWGTYTVKETKAPLGYKLSDKTKAVTINSSDVSQVQGLTFTDNRILGKLDIAKIGRAGTKLEGAEFTVNGPDGFKEVVTTGKNGVASLSNLPWGIYTVKEIKAPQGYALSDKIQNITINSKNVEAIQRLTFIDNKILGQLSITKVGKGGAKLKGAQFTITGPNGYKKIITTNVNGIATISNLKWGSYNIIETRAPEGYSLNSKTYLVKIDADNANIKQNVVVVDGQLTGNIKITKEGVNKEKLSGATFEITGPNGFNRAITTGKDGSVNLSGLAWGKYTIKEIIAPQGYLINKTAQVIDINSVDVNKVQNIIFIDNKILGQIDIIKTNIDGNKKLSGAEFTITGPNGFKKVLTTNSQGTINLKGLKWGIYNIKETKAPQGYTLSNKVQTININSEDVKMIKYLTFKDSLIVINKGNNNVNYSESYQITSNNNNNLSNKENNKNSNNKINSSEESPKTGDESELPIVLILFGAIVSLLVINRKKLKDKIEV